MPCDMVCRECGSGCQAKCCNNPACAPNCLAGAPGTSSSIAAPPACSPHFHGPSYLHPKPSAQPAPRSCCFPLSTVPSITSLKKRRLSELLACYCAGTSQEEAVLGSRGSSASRLGVGSWELGVGTSSALQQPPRKKRRGLGGGAVCGVIWESGVGEEELSEEEGMELCLCDVSEGEWGREFEEDEEAESESEEVKEVWPAACVHHHGSVFTITALCQGCHANRWLEVV